MERKNTGSQTIDVGFGTSFTGEQGERACDAAETAVKYRLYVGPLQDLSEEVEFSFYDSRRGFLFVFSDHKPDGKYALMTDELMEEMSDSERNWYNQSCYIVNERWIEYHEQEAADTVNSFLAEFEEELKREAERTKETEGTADGRGEDPTEELSPAGD